MVDILVTMEFRCPACDGSGLYKIGGSLVDPKTAPCVFCGATGDQREMPESWRTCPARHRDAYHVSLR